LWIDICTLWGQSFGEADSESQLDASRKALVEIERLLGIVRELKQRGLYSLVPSNAVVPDQIHRTNSRASPWHDRFELIWKKRVRQTSLRKLEPPIAHKPILLPINRIQRIAEFR